MADVGSARLSDLLVGAARRGTPFPAETGLFLVLQTAEALRDKPCSADSQHVRVTTEGTIELDGAPNASASDALRAIAVLLEKSVTPLPAPAREFLGKLRAGSVASLPDAVAELEALLVPLNRSAARRVLGRLVREHAKAPVVAAPASAIATAISAESATQNAEVSADALLPRDAAEQPAPPSSTDTVIDSEPRVPSRLPPPPRLGSLSSLGDSLQKATDTEPDPRDPQSAITTAPEGARAGATATQPSGNATESDSGEESDSSPPEKTNPAPGKALFLFAAFVLGAAFLFFLARLFSG